MPKKFNLPLGVQDFPIRRKLVHSHQLTCRKQVVTHSVSRSQIEWANLGFSPFRNDREQRVGFKILVIQQIGAMARDDDLCFL